MRKECSLFKKLILLTGFMVSIGMAVLFWPGVVFADEKEYPVFDFSGQLLFYERYATGESISLPDPKVTAGTKAIPYTITVEKQEEDRSVVIDRFEGGTKQSYVFSESGSYVLSYTATASGGSRSKGFSIQVEDGAYIDCSALPGRIAANGGAVTLPDVWLIGGTAKEKAELVSAVGPDGLPAAMEGNQFTPYEVGSYILTYSAKDGDVSYTAQKQISVGLEYTDLFTGNTAVTGMATDSAVPEYAAAGNGVLFSVKSGGVIRWNNVLDLRKISSDKNIVSFQPIYNALNPTFQQITVTLTDAHDSSNVLTLQWSDTREEAAWTYKNSYLLAGTGGKLYGTSQYNGALYQNMYGTVVMNTFRGPKGQESNGGNPVPQFAFRFDCATNRVLTNCATDYYQGAFTVIDLDDTELFGDEAWKGFTTGEVYLEIRVPTLNMESQVIVTEVGGVPLGGNAPAAGNSAPVLEIGASQEYLAAGKLPDAVVGENYPVPSVAAWDVLFGSARATTTVKDENGKKLSLQNGFVKPEAAGNYTIEYVGVDAFGTKTSKTFSFTAKASAEILPVTAEFTDEVLTAYAGDRYKVPSIAVYGGSGTLTHREELYLNDAPTETDETGSVFLWEKGTLEIRVFVQDYLYPSRGEYRVSLQIPVLSHKEPVIKILGQIPYAEAGTTIVIPDFEAVDYEGGASVYRSIYVNGKRLNSDRTFAVAADATELLVEYVARCGNTESLKTVRIPVYASNKYPEYKNGYVMAGIQTEDYVFVEARESEGVFLKADCDFTAGFAHLLPTQGFTVAFKLSGINASSAYVDVRLSDFTGEKNMTFRIYPKDRIHSYLQLNGTGERREIAGSFFDESQTFRLTIQNGKIYSGDAAVFTLERYEDGRLYDGFGGAAYLKIAVHGNGGAGTLGIYQVANQTFLPAGGFFIDSGPVLSYGGTMKNHILGRFDKVVLPTAEAYDVLSGKAQVSMKVVSPDGGTLYEGEPSAYEFLLSSYGDYKVTYTATDARGKTTAETYTFTSADEESPVIFVNGKVAETTTKKAGIPIPSASAFDEKDGEVTVIVWVQDVYGNYCSAQFDKTFKPLTAGTYRVVYYAYDSSYNGARLSYTVETNY